MCHNRDNIRKQLLYKLVFFLKSFHLHCLKVFRSPKASDMTSDYSTKSNILDIEFNPCYAFTVTLTCKIPLTVSHPIADRPNFGSDRYETPTLIGL